MTTDRRQRLITKAHIAKAQLGMDDATYRAVLQRATGKTSSADCTVAQLADLMNEFLRLGFKATTRGGRKPAAAGGARRISQAQLDKIEALLAGKAAAQGAPVPWSYADAMARRICRVAKVQWLTPDQAGKVIAALEIDQRRRETERLRALARSLLSKRALRLGTLDTPVVLNDIAFALFGEENWIALTDAELSLLNDHLTADIVAGKVLPKTRINEVNA